MADRKQKINPKVFFTGPPENASYKKGLVPFENQP